MTEQQTVTVAGVPVTVQATDGVLTVTIGRFDPAASGPLHLDPRFGTATVGVYIADETGETAHRQVSYQVSDAMASVPAH